MIAIFLSWSVATIAFAVIAIEAVRFVRQRTKQLGSLMESRADFFKSADILLNDDATPAAVVEMLAYLGDNLGNPKIGRMLLVAGFRGDLRASIRKTRKAESELVSAVDGLRPELRKQFGVACAGALFSATYANIFLGTLIRQMMLYWVEKDDEQKEAEILVADIMQQGRPPRSAAA